MPFGFERPGPVDPHPRQAINAAPPPWAYTSTRPGGLLPHPTMHLGVQHPAPTHFPQPAATPFAEGAYALNGRLAAARRHFPAVLSPGGLAYGTRK